MDQLILKSRNTQLTNENQLLKSQVLHLTERFNVIVKWINNQFYGLLGVPDEVIVAISGNLDFITPVRRCDDRKSLIGRGNPNSLTPQTNTSECNKSLSNNPFIALEKLNLINIQSLADSNEITNYNAIVESLFKLKQNITDNSPITCRICKQSFMLNIQLKKHKMVHLMKNGNKPERTRRKVSVSKEIKQHLNTNEYTFLKLEMLSESNDNDTSPLYDPLDDSEEIKNSDTSCSLNPSFIDSFSKDDIEIKEEFLEEMESQTFSECETPNTLRKTLTKRGYYSPVKNNLNPPRRYKKIGKMNKESLKCKICGKQFPMFCRLRVHEQKCQVPINVFIERPQYNSHAKSNLPTRVYRKKGKIAEDSLKCKVCDKVFPMFCRLRVHEQKCHNIPIESVIVTETEIEGIKKSQITYRCLKCEDCFSSKDTYFLHLKICNPEALKNKIEKQNGDAICDICGKSFINNRVLNQHLRFVHQGEKNFLCTECGKSFSRLDTLRNHERCHTGIKTFKCNYCDKTFVRRQARYTHEKRHLGTLKANCQICGFEFASKAKLKLHIQSIHENQRSHQCPQCEKCFKRKTHLDYHVKTHDNPNSRKRGLNKDIDHMKAAKKRRHCNKKNEIFDVVNAKDCLSDNANSLLTWENNST